MKTPCVQVCQMDPQRGLCLGCHRTLDEIGRWGSMSDAEREKVLADLPVRQPTRSVDWYFDFVSPYSYIAFHRLAMLERPVVHRPVLFAGLLDHWGQKGPAEIPAKRRWTYRWCTWWAAELGIPFRFPAGHPFNPLPHLRLALAARCDVDALRMIFDAVWTTGNDAADPAHFSALREALGVSAEEMSSPRVKEQLRRNTEEAAVRGVFGVPTLVIDGEVFWGADAHEFARAYLVDAATLQNEEMHRVDALPIAAARKT